MKLDDNNFIGVRARGTLSMLDVSKRFYLGGVPYSVEVNSASMKNVGSSFVGCVEFLKVD